MKIRALSIFLGKLPLGTLIQALDDAPQTRFIAHRDLAGEPLLSLSMLANDPQAQRALWSNLANPLFHGCQSKTNGWLLPNFFQNLLPEGAQRERIAALRGCAPADHFELLAACGRDLPGNVSALPCALTHGELARLLKQAPETLETVAVAPPLADAASIPGIWPKLGLIRHGERYLAPGKRQGAHIIAKLPQAALPGLPEVEELSLRLARAAGVNACEARSEPMQKLAHLTLPPGDAPEPEEAAGARFLAVTRFDRVAGRRIHCEDFAQILNLPPEQKYSGSYLDIAAVMMSEPSLGEAAVHELLRRLAVNEMLGNPDMHLNNIGLIYRDGKTPALSPAYDIVAYAAFHKSVGHALHLVPPGMLEKLKIGVSAPTAGHKPGLSPALLRGFCAALGIIEKAAQGTIRDTVRLAARQWPAMIAAADLAPRQQERLLLHVEAHPMLQSLRKRGARGGA